MTPDKLSPGVAQVLTKKPNKPKRDLAAFRRMILELDPVCRACGKKSLRLGTMLSFAVMVGWTFQNMVWAFVETVTISHTMAQRLTAFDIQRCGGCYGYSNSWSTTLAGVGPAYMKNLNGSGK